MSIRLVVTAGYGNGTFNGTIKDVTLRGYSLGVFVLPGAQLGVSSLITTTVGVVSDRKTQAGKTRRRDK